MFAPARHLASPSNKSLTSILSPSPRGEADFIGRKSRQKRRALSAGNGDAMVAQPLLFGVRFNVLVHAKEIIGIVFVFDLDESLVIVAVGFFHAFFTFVAHQEVYVCPTS